MDNNVLALNRLLIILFASYSKKGNVMKKLIVLQVVGAALLLSCAVHATEAEKKLGRELIKAVQDKDKGEVDTVLKKISPVTPDVEDPNGDGKTAIWYALDANKPEEIAIFEALLEHGFNSAIANKDTGRTPLIEAAFGWVNKKVFEDLLERPEVKQTINNVDKKGKNALDYAIENNDEQYQQLLKANGAKESAKKAPVKKRSDKEIGQDIIKLAQKPESGGSYSLSSLLNEVQQVTDEVQNPNKDGKTALWYLVRDKGSLDVDSMIEDLLKKGFSPAISDTEKGMTPLMKAAEVYGPDALTILLEFPSAIATINQKSKDGRTALDYANLKLKQDLLIAQKAVSGKGQEKKSTDLQKLLTDLTGYLGNLTKTLKK